MLAKGTPICLAICLAGGIHAVLQHGPTNRLLRWLRTRHGLKWSIPAMAIGITYLWAATPCTAIIDRGGPDWLHALALLFIWNGLKLLINRPIGLFTLVRARIGGRSSREPAME